MIQSSGIINVSDIEESSILPLAWGTLESLGWSVKHAGPRSIIAQRGRREMVVGIKGGELVAGSRHTSNHSLDLLGKNKKNTREFLNTFELVKQSNTEAQIFEWRKSLGILQEETALKLAGKLKEDEEIDSISNGSTSNLFVTYSIIAINVIVFVAMLVKGIDLFAPTGEDIVKWGGNYGPMTSSGDWWRLLTSVFVHIGIIHLVFNMYALFTIGNYLEPMLGKTRYLAAYLSTGIFASLASLWWHDPPVASAGASGAVFGAYGVFLALLCTNLIPHRVRKQLLQSIGIFIGYNLLYGMKAGVDNAAHIGGLVSGFAIGFIYYLQLRKKENAGHPAYQPALVIGATVLAAFFFLRGNAREIPTGDSQEFSKTMEHFAALEELALEAMQVSDTTSKDVYIARLKKDVTGYWVACVNIFDEAGKLELDPKLSDLRRHMLDYSKQRVQETLLLVKLQEDGTDRYAGSIDSVQQEINRVIKKIQDMSAPSSEAAPRNL